MEVISDKSITKHDTVQWVYHIRTGPAAVKRQAFDTQQTMTLAYF